MPLGIFGEVLFLGYRWGGKKAKPFQIQRYDLIHLLFLFPIKSSTSFSLKATKNDLTWRSIILYTVQFMFIMLTFPDNMHSLETRKTNNNKKKSTYNDTNLTRILKMDLAKIFAFKYMAIFREPNLNFREFSHVNSEKMPAKGHFLIFNLIVVVLSIVLSTLILLLRRFLLGRRFSKGSSAQRLWLLLQGWIKGRGTDAPWKKKTRNKKNSKSVWMPGCI